MTLQVARAICKSNRAAKQNQKEEKQTRTFENFYLKIQTQLKFKKGFKNNRNLTKIGYRKYSNQK